MKLASHGLISPAFLSRLSWEEKETETLCKLLIHDITQQKMSARLSVSYTHTHTHANKQTNKESTSRFFPQNFSFLTIFLLYCSLVIKSNIYLVSI